MEEELTHNADLLVKTLSSFGVQTRMMDISRGPSVTGTSCSLLRA